MRPERDLQRCGNGHVRPVELQPRPARYLDELVTDFGVQGVEPLTAQACTRRATCGIPNPEWRHHFRTGMGDAVERGPLAHLALLRQRRKFQSGYHGQHRLRPGQPELLRPRGELAGHRRRRRFCWASTTSWTRIHRSPRLWVRRATATRSRRPTTRWGAGSSCAARSGSDTRSLGSSKLAAASQGAAAFWVSALRSARRAA